ncbi:esterase/lipase family protein [Streptomyces albicerus]|uniref:esterase/lipase family protein n=1 Tax=Streptomyces albicerus TaxID=2569859 RepID=UPI001788A2DE|nr:alpha/beta fold hydrolase [Streptomyces albicerus]
MSVESVSRTGRSRAVTLSVCLIAIVAAVLGTSLPAHSAPQNQPPRAKAGQIPDPPLPDADNWLCRPTERHPDPVVLVHGLFATPSVNWPFVAEGLRKAGFCVFALTYGTGNGEYPLPAVAPLEESAKDLKHYVDRVRIVTGAKKVDLVGHSAGGLMPRQYLRFEGGARFVDDLVALGPPNHGTEFRSPWHDMPKWVANAFCPSCLQFTAGSKFIVHLNEGHEVEPGVSYTTISTKLDEYIIPYTSARLKGAPGQVTNITVQEKCPGSTINHLGLAFDAVPLQWVVNALERPGPADPAFQPIC